MGENGSKNKVPSISLGACGWLHVELVWHSRIVTQVMSAADDMGLDAANRICQIERRSYRSGAPTPSVARDVLQETSN